MSTAPEPPKSKSSAKKDKKRDTVEKAHNLTERLKTVVRRLPPNLPEEVFWGSVATWATDEAVTWKVYYPGKLKKRLNKENIPSRAYITFKNEEQLAVFSKEYDGHMFRDKAGNEYQAVVEFAPYQKVPSDKRKVDARNGTIEKDEDYISFIASLKAAESAEPPTLEDLILAAQPAPVPKTTPLLEALKAEKSAHKDKETILRSHAHYKDGATILAPPPRGSGADSKKKGGAQVPPASASKAAESSIKKGGKKQVPAAPSQGKQPPPATPATPGVKPGAGGAGAKPPKTPRPPKPAKQPQAQQPKQPPPASAPVPVIAIATPSSATPAPAAAPAAPRRSRPVIGLASRQFEAALSGVAGGAARQRREQAPPPPKDGPESTVPNTQAQNQNQAQAGGSNVNTGAKPPRVRPANNSNNKEKEKHPSTPAKAPVAPATGNLGGEVDGSGGRGGHRRGRGRGGGAAGGRGGAPRGG